MCKQVHLILVRQNRMGRGKVKNGERWERTKRNHARGMLRMQLTKGFGDACFTVCGGRSGRGVGHELSSSSAVALLIVIKLWKWEGVFVFPSSCLEMS